VLDSDAGLIVFINILKFSLICQMQKKMLKRQIRSHGKLIKHYSTTKN